MSSGWGLAVGLPAAAVVWWIAPYVIVRRIVRGVVRSATAATRRDGAAR